MTDLTTLLAGIKARAEAATPGPWKADTGVRGDCVVWGPNGRFLMNAQAEPHWLEYPGETRSVSFDVDARDAAFIAAARTDVPRLVAALEAADAELARRAAALDETAKHLIQQVIDRDINRDPENAQRYSAYATAADAALRTFRTAMVAALREDK